MKLERYAVREFLQSDMLFYEQFCEIFGARICKGILQNKESCNP